MSNPTATRERRAPLTVVQQDLARRFLPLARSLAKPYKLNWPTARDEFDSAACLALVEAAESYDPERRVKFATFARHRIYGALRDVQRTMLPLGWRCDVAHAPSVISLPHDPEEQGRVLGIHPNDPLGGDFEALEFVESMLRKLPPRHAAACREIYVHGKTQHAAARSLGMSQSRLSYIHCEAMSMLNGSWAAAILGTDGAAL